MSTEFAPFQHLIVESGDGTPVSLSDAFEAAFAASDVVALKKEVVLLIAERIQYLSFELLGNGGSWG